MRSDADQLPPLWLGLLDVSGPATDDDREDKRDTLTRIYYALVDRGVDLVQVHSAITLARVDGWWDTTAHRRQHQQSRERWWNERLKRPAIDGQMLVHGLRRLLACYPPSGHRDVTPEMLRRRHAIETVIAILQDEALLDPRLARRLADQTRLQKGRGNPDTMRLKNAKTALKALGVKSAETGELLWIIGLRPAPTTE